MRSDSDLASSFIHDPRAMGLDCRLADPQVRGNRPVAPAGHDRVQDLPLPRGKPLQPLLDVRQAHGLTADLGIPVHGPVHGVKLDLIFKRLLDEVHRPGLHLLAAA
jgi:hypothetical protein